MGACHGTCDGGVVGGSHHVHVIGTGIGRQPGEVRPTVTHLEITHNGVLGVRLTQSVHDLHALFDHQAGAGLEPIDPGMHGDLRNMQGIRDGMKIERNLHTTRHGMPPHNDVDTVDIKISDVGILYT
jgi:hypothetical protein